MNDLSNLFSFGFGSGKQSTAAGSSNLDKAGGYYSSLLSGSRPALQQAIAPETNQVLSAGDAQRRQQAAMGTARGGGVAATNETQRDTQNQTIDNALFAARPAAAKGATDVGSAQANLGLNELKTGGDAASAFGDIATKARDQASSEDASAINAGIGLIFG